MTMDCVLSALKREPIAADKEALAFTFRVLPCMLIAPRQPIRKSDWRPAWPRPARTS